ncbi:MAG: NAD(P)H-dependent oxidoreductase [Labilithrix sp.]|nr:NAD(P)H-dependent oxidoreductase [Labilithrix sp.]MCW5818186.1 NAD(P)H-dependent oxidoreductase [Labilithrix sp.]
MAVVYHSVGGRTRALAEHVAAGARAIAGAEVDLLAVEDAHLHLVSRADAIVFGCPTYMGSASAAFKAFMDGTSAIWAVQGWRDKIAGAFTHSAAPSGDKLGTLVQLAVFAAQHGMIWVGLGLPPAYASSDAAPTDTNRLGSHLGAMAQSRPGGGAVPESDLRTAEVLGRRIAEAARRWGPNAALRSERHPAAQAWAFPPADRPAPPPGIARANLRELVARPARFEHHLVVCASIGPAQLEVTAASEPLYFAHINLSDEVVVALPTGDDLVDRFPLRTFLARPNDGVDAGRYNHKNGDAVLHPEGWLHWPGRLRPPYAPFDFPPGMRRTGLSVVYCASAPTKGRPHVTEAPPGRAEDVKAYVEPSPPMSLSDLRTAGRVATIGSTRLDLVVRPDAIAPPRGGFVVVLEADAASAFACDLLRIAPGARLDGAGIVRALVLSSDDVEPDPVPPSWHEVPPPPFPPFEEGAPGALPFVRDGLRVEDGGDVARVTIGGAAAEVPRYWLARMLYRVALHGLRLGWVETYGGLYTDDRGDALRIGLRAGAAPLVVPRAEALRFVEELYRAVAPAGYVERLR